MIADDAPHLLCIAIMPLPSLEYGKLLEPLARIKSSIDGFAINEEVGSGDSEQYIKGR